MSAAAEARALLEAADPCDWHQRGGGPDVYGGADGLTRIAKASVAAWSRTEANAALIAAAPMLLRSLIAELEVAS